LAAFGKDAQAADDVKYFNGSFCRIVALFGDPATQGLLDYNAKGMVSNWSTTSPIKVACPIVRDILDHDNGWDSLEIGYSDKNPQSAIQCNVFSGSPDGTLSNEQMGTSVNTFGSSWGKAGMVFGSNGGGYDWGFYFIRCVLPPAPDVGMMSGIAYYRIGES